MSLVLLLCAAIVTAGGLAWWRYGAWIATLAVVGLLGIASLSYGVGAVFNTPPRSDGTLSRFLTRQDEGEATEILRRWAAYRLPDCQGVPQNIDTYVVETQPAKVWQDRIVAGAWFERDTFQACGHALDLTVVGWIDGHGQFRRRSAAPGSTHLLPQAQDRFLALAGAARFDDAPRPCQPVVIDVALEPNPDAVPTPTSVATPRDVWRERWTFRTCFGDIIRSVQFTKVGSTIHPDYVPLDQEHARSTAR